MRYELANDVLDESDISRVSVSIGNCCDTAQLVLLFCITIKTTTTKLIHSFFFRYLFLQMQQIRRTKNAILFNVVARVPRNKT